MRHPLLNVSRPAATVCLLVHAVGCVAQGTGLLQRDHPDDEKDGGAPMFLGDASRPEDEYELPPVDPHAVRGVDPAHGSFAGGQRAIVRGAGFATTARVWFGATEVAPENVTAIDPKRLQVVVPPGLPGPVDVSVQNGDDSSTRRSLADAYTYDAFYVVPSSGPTAGGTVITLHGSGTSWDMGTTVTVDLSSCEVLAVRNGAKGEQELDCRTPPGAQGAKPVSVTDDGRSATVLDAFVYGNSDDGFRGGLSGEALSDRLRVIALDDTTGKPIPSATVIVGDDESGVTVAHASADGVAIVERQGLGPEVTVTVAASCFMPITFASVPVDTVTAYLDPIVSPACSPEGDPPLVGGAAGSAASSISGQIVFPNPVEFRRATWHNVPSAAAPGSRNVAYVFELSRNSKRTFQLPSAGAATTPESDGDIGYEFQVPAHFGNLTLYALAGVENRDLDPPLFTAYVMGLVSGVLGEPNGSTGEVFIPMNVPLDHALTVTVDGPAAGTRGPDRLTANVAVRVGSLGYVILPSGQRESLLSDTNSFGFVGLPAFQNELEGARYVVTASAVTGYSAAPPLSVIGAVSPSPGTTALSLDGFLEVPRVDHPNANGAWSGVELSVASMPGGPAADLTIVDVSSAVSGARWRIVAAGDPGHVRLPDPRDFPEMGIPKGSVSIDVTRALVDDFTYGTLGDSDLAERSFRAFATDTVQAHLE